jgi:hypothetical protein
LKVRYVFYPFMVPAGTWLGFVHPDGYLVITIGWYCDLLLRAACPACCTPRVARCMAHAAWCNDGAWRMPQAVQVL